MEMAHNSNNLLFTTPGNVGIGTTNPKVKLMVETPYSNDTETLLKLSHRSATTSVGARIELGSYYENAGHVRITGYLNPNQTHATQLQFETMDINGATWHSIRMDDLGHLNINALAGTGNAFACLDSSGTLYRSAVACN